MCVDKCWAFEFAPLMRKQGNFTTPLIIRVNAVQHNTHQIIKANYTLHVGDHYKCTFTLSHSALMRGPKISKRAYRPSGTLPTFSLNLIFGSPRCFNPGGQYQTELDTILPRSCPGRRFCAAVPGGHHRAWGGAGRAAPSSLERKKRRQQPLARSIIDNDKIRDKKVPFWYFHEMQRRLKGMLQLRNGLCTEIAISWSIPGHQWIGISFASELSIRGEKGQCSPSVDPLTPGWSSDIGHVIWGDH